MALSGRETAVSASAVTTWRQYDLLHFKFVRLSVSKGVNGLASTFLCSFSYITVTSTLDILLNFCSRMSFRTAIVCFPKGLLAMVIDLRWPYWAMTSSRMARS